MIMIGEIPRIDTETGTRVIPAADELLQVVPAAADVLRHVSGRTMTREQLLGRVTCFYQGFVEPCDLTDTAIAAAIWRASAEAPLEAAVAANALLLHRDPIQEREG